MEAQTCALLHLQLNADGMLEAANLLEDHHLDFQAIEGRKTDPGEWNISVVAETEYIGVGAYGPWGWSLFSVNDHVYLSDGCPWSSFEARDQAGRVFMATVERVCDLLSAKGAVFLRDDLRDRMEAWAAGRQGVGFDDRVTWLREHCGPDLVTIGSSNEPSDSPSSG